MEICNSWKKLRKIFWTGLIIRFLLLAVLMIFIGESALLFSDTREYLGLADSLRQGHGFWFHDVAYTLRTPGYPAFLAALGGSSSIQFISIIQIIIASAIPILTYHIARQLGFTERISIIAAWITALEPHMVYYSIPILPDAVFTVFFLLFILAGMHYVQKQKRRDLLFTSALFATLLYIKPVLQAFPFYLAIAAVIIAFSKKTWRPIKDFIVFSAIVFLLAFPWMFRNAQVGGGFSMSSQGPALVAFKLATSVMSLRDHITFDEAERILETRWDKATPIPIKEVSAYLLQHPTELARVLAMNSILLWTSQTYTYIPNYYGFLPLPPAYTERPPSVLLLQGKVMEFGREMLSLLRYPYIPLAIIGKLLWTLVAAMFFYGLLKGLMQKNESAWALHVFVALLVLCYTMTTWIDGFNVEARLRYPFNPLMFVYGTAAAVLVLRSLRKMLPSYG